MVAQPVRLGLGSELLVVFVHGTVPVNHLLPSSVGGIVLFWHPQKGRHTCSKAATFGSIALTHFEEVRTEVYLG